MTDTATKPEKVAKSPTKPKRPRDVIYGGDIGVGPMNDLPPMPPRKSHLNKLVEAVEGTPNQWVPISSYNAPGTASAVATTLRKRYPLAKGWDFASRRQGDRSIVFCKFNKG